MKKKILISILLPFLFLTGCSKAEASYDAVGTYKSTYYNESEESKSDIVIETTAKIIYTVDYTINSTNFEEIRADITQKTYDIEGYVESSDESKTYARIVYRIPTDKLDEFVDYVDSKDGVGNKEISTSDVSSTYSQVEARLKVLNDSKTYYNQYLEENEGSLSLTDKIAILDKISDIDTEIYEYSYQKAKLDSKLDYSTVTIRYYENEEDESFFGSYGEYLGNFFVGLFEFIMYALPVLFVCGILFVCIYFPIRAKQKRKLNKQ